jgi:hypothetical protein
MAFEYTPCTIFHGTDFDTDHNRVVARIRERLAVSKQTAQNFDVGRFRKAK